MACTGCGGSSCRGCKDITVTLLNNTVVESLSIEGDTITATYTDGTTEDLVTTAEVPNDAWVELDETDMTAVNFTGTATHNSTAIDLIYKILSEDTVVVKVQQEINVTIDDRADSLNNNFRFAPFGSSDWFVGTKIFSPLVQRVPIAIYTSTATSAVPWQIGTAIVSTLSSENLISIANTNLQMPNGTFNFFIHFEITCKIV